MLLCCSALFSGSETAFFNLSPRQLQLMRRSKHRLQTITANLLEVPGKLLSCLLFSNITVNVLYFAVASVLTVKIERNFTSSAAAANAFAAFLLLLLFGEIIPKSIAYSNSKAISIIAAVPILLLLRLLTPILAAFRFLFIDPGLRLLLGPAKLTKEITTDEFKQLIEQGRKGGFITSDENKIITEIVELGMLKVRDSLRPRVDMITCPVTESNLAIRKIMNENNLTKIPVYAKNIDNIVGMVHLRLLLLNPDTSPDKLVVPAHFVPEQKTIESLLESFRTSGTDTAIAVDEYGGIAGSISLEDIAEELLGPIDSTEKIEPVEQLGTMKYRLAGNMAIHDWAQNFGIDIAENRISTIAGLVIVILGKIPKPGDTASWRNLKFTVESVKKHRIETIILTLEPLTNNDQ
ncbi:hemolysin family protein [Planctomycetota bacterium]